MCGGGTGGLLAWGSTLLCSDFLNFSIFCHFFTPISRDPSRDLILQGDTCKIRNNFISHLRWTPALAVQYSVFRVQASVVLKKAHQPSKGNATIYLLSVFAILQRKELFPHSSCASSPSNLLPCRFSSLVSCPLSVPFLVRGGSFPCDRVYVWVCVSAAVSLCVSFVSLQSHPALCFCATWSLWFCMIMSLMSSRTITPAAHTHHVSFSPSLLRAASRN